MTSAPTITYSVLIPVLNEEANVAALTQRLGRVLDGLAAPAEIIFVDDGSTDGTLEALRRARSTDSRIRVVQLTRRFGHQRALTAALDLAHGQACILMDGDLQDPPETIPSLVERWKAGYEIVYAVRTERRGESYFKRATAALFYRILGALTDIRIPPDAGDFRLLDRRVVDALQQLRERGRFLRGLVHWTGYRQTSVPYDRDSRAGGRSKYGIGAMLRLAFDAITAFSTSPLQLAIWFGALFSISSFLYAGYVLYVHSMIGRTITGWTSLMIVILFFGGVQLLFLGILGEYLGRIFEEVKQRPLYLIRSKEGFETDAR